MNQENDKKDIDIHGINEDQNKDLHSAIENDEDLEVIESLLNVGKVNLNEKKGIYEETPFLCAARKGNLPVLKLLKNKGAHVHEVDSSRHNALHYAINPDIPFEVIEWLVNVAKLNVNVEGGFDDRTPFLVAAELGSLPILKLLKDQGADVHFIDRYNGNALYWATEYNGKFEVIEWLVNVAKVNVDGHEDKIPFISAAKAGNLPVLKLLKDQGANVHATDELKRSALCWATANNKNEIKGQVTSIHIADYSKGDLLCKHVLYDIKYCTTFEVIEWLVNVAKVNINDKGTDQKTPFLLAAELGNFATLKFLKNKEANVHATDQYNNNALQLAIENHAKFEVIEWLVNVAKVNIIPKEDGRETPFLLAAKAGNLPVLKLLKDQGVNVHVTNQFKQNALFLAILGDSKLEVIEWLVNVAKVNIDAKEVGEKTPFLAAAEACNLATLKFLKNKGANVHARDEENRSALSLAIHYHTKFEVIEWLVNVVKVSADTKDGHEEKTPFLYAAAVGNLPTLKLLKDQGFNVHATDQNNRNALYLAIFSAELEAVEWLVNVAKVDINGKDRYEKKTPFLLAAETGNLSILKLLKDKGAHVNEVDLFGDNALVLAIARNAPFEVIGWLVNVAKVSVNPEGKSSLPIQKAAIRGDLSLLKLLKDKGAHVNDIDAGDHNPLLSAIDSKEDVELVEWLIKVGKVNINKQNSLGITPFMYAARLGHLRTLKLLKDQGADVQLVDKYNNNALQAAIEYDTKFEIIEWLVHVAKLNLNGKDRYEKKTPFLFAAERGKLSILKLLKDEGAEVDTVDENGHNALWYAERNKGSTELLNWLKKECGLR